MRLTFTKRGGKHDDLLVERDGHAAETVTCPKQGIIPHDMVHYAVESTLAHRGFLSLVADGQCANFAAVGGEGEEAVERLVEASPAQRCGGRGPAAALLATDGHACEARGHAVAPVSSPEVDAIRARLDELAEQWAQLPVNGSIELQF
jgi:hypothetical protein